MPEGTVWPGWYPADDLEVEVLCGPWMWEPLAEQQRCPERFGIGRKLEAKCRPDEQEAHMRRPHPGEEANFSKARYIPEDADVDATGTRHEGHASYPGKSVVLPAPFGERVLPALQGVGMGRQMTAEAVVVAGTAAMKGRT